MPPAPTPAAPARVLRARHARPAQPAGPPTGAFARDQRGTVQLQKNQQHEAATGSPGNFTVSLWGPSSPNGEVISYRPDDTRPSLSMYELEVFIRNETKPGQYILQAVYNTANPAAPAQFFQCADITVL
jgi:hypothetical protein